MPSRKICKTIHQYNKEPIPHEDMCKLQEIAQDYSKVKNYVYQRYGGISSLSKIYPGYTVQNEMTASGLRSQLGLPAVYFYLAVFDALGDIKTQWSKTKNDILDAIRVNDRFTPADRHYLRFVIKVSGCFDNIVNGKEIVVPKAMAQQFNDILAQMTNLPSAGVENLNKYLCRQVRRKLCKLHTDKEDGFSITERAYRYGMCGKKQGIFISTKENRKRVFIPLTDENCYNKQLYIKLMPNRSSIKIDVPIEVKIQQHKDYQNEIGISIGVWQMFTTDRGTIYGEQFGKLHEELVEYMRTASKTYYREKANNPGREKYKARKAKLDARLEAYINQEINRLLIQEKPYKIYLPKLPRNSIAGHNRKINYSITVWRKGFIRNRLEQKCKENAVEIVEVFGKGISTECSVCGASTTGNKDLFVCSSCGYQADKKINAAQNAIKRGKAEQQHTINK